MPLTDDGPPRLYWEIGGPEHAPPLLLIRGLARSARYWLEFRALLERSRRVIVFDNRGVGRSDTPRLFWRTQDMADDAARVLRACEVSSADVFGISLGGMVAQQLAIRHPEKVRDLVLACTSRGGKGSKRISLCAAAALAQTARMSPRDAQRTNAEWVLSAAYLRRHPEIVDTWAEIAAQEPRSARGLLGQVAAGARHRAAAEISNVGHRTLVISGDADRLMPTTNSELLAAALPNATLEWVAGAGHDFPTERPDETAERVLDFLAKSQ